MGIDRRTSRFNVVLSSVLALALLAACATRSEEKLQEARSALAAARSDPAVQTQATAQLADAERALERAEAAWAAAEPQAEIDHLAYLAEQRAAIATAVTTERVAQEDIRALAEARERSALNAAEARAAALERQLAELQAKETERGLVLTLGDILFDVDGADLKPGGMQQVGRVADFLSRFPERNVLVEGHTDSTGAADYNMNLSLRRANAVQDFLISQGIDPRRISARGYGQQYPVASNDTSAGRQQNRRVEIVILDEGEIDAPRAATSG